MSDLAFTLQLVDEITGPGKLAQDQLRKLQEQAKAAGNALDFSAQAKAAVNSLAAIKLDPKGFLAAHEATKRLAEEQRRLVRGHEGFGSGLTSALSSPFASMTSAVALGELAGAGIIKAGEFLIDAAVKVGEIIKDGIGLAFESGGKQERLNTSFKYLFGGKDGAKAALEQADALSGKLPFGGLKTAGYIGDLGRAGIKGQSASNSLALAADAGALSPSGQGTDEAIAALSRLKRHGEFSPRLAEGLNVNLTDFYAALGKKLNISAAAAQKKLGEPGKIGFNTIQNTLMDVHQKAIGGAKTGSVAVDQSKELLARWEKIQELPAEYLRKMVEAPGWKTLSDTLGNVLGNLDPKNHPEIVNGLLDAFNQLAVAATSLLKAENIDKFVAAINVAVSVTEKLAGALMPVVNAIDKVTDFQIRAVSNVKDFFSGEQNDPAIALQQNRLRLMHEQVASQNAATGPDAKAGAGKAIGNLFDTMTGLHQEQAKAQETYQNYADYKPDAAPYPLTAGAQQSQRPITIAPTINVTVQAAPGDTAEDHGKAVAEAASKHMSSALERAAQQSGAM